MTTSLPPLSTWIRTLDLPLAEDKQSGWQPYPILRGTTPCLADLSCHASVLSPGKTPHEPHVHAEEEILLMLAGEADLLIVADEPVPTETRQRLRPGSFVYYPAHQRHTLHNPGPECATYLMFKWQSAPAANNGSLETLIVEFLTNEPSSLISIANGFLMTDVLNGGTRYLRTLHAHLTTLQPGAGYPPHEDAYDVAILTIGGTIETLGQQVGPNSVIFYAGGEPHGMKNVGTSPAVYVVFEFHGNNPDFSGSMYPDWLNRIKSFVRLPLRMGRFVKRSFGLFCATAKYFSTPKRSFPPFAGNPQAVVAKPHHP
jgi:quercetin dioxygenase-like cupin family protein